MMMMTGASTAAAAADLFLAFMALEIHSFLDPQQLDADLPQAAQAAQLDSAVELLLPLAALGILTTASAAIYRHLQQHPAAGNRRRRLRRLFATLCASAATLEFFFFVAKPKPAGVDVAGDVVGALGLAAARALPAAAAATFFVGMALVIVVVAHIRAGGEGGGGRGGIFAVAAADGDFHGAAVSFLTKTAFAAAAALICLTALALWCSTATVIY